MPPRPIAIGSPATLFCTIAAIAPASCALRILTENRHVPRLISAILPVRLPAASAVHAVLSDVPLRTTPSGAVRFDDTFAKSPDTPAYVLPPTVIGAATKSYFVSGNDDFMAGFSSQGPTDVDFRIKPDVVAPGVNVLSSIPAAFCAAPPCWAFFQGTSMATPHLAGSAAVVLGQHPGWSAAQVRSAVVNTADQNVLKKSSSTAKETNVFVIGAGRENLTSAVNAKVGLDPVSVSFGAVPSGSGQSDTRSVVLTQFVPGSYAASISPSTGTGVTYSVAPSPGGFVITMTAAKKASAGIHQAKLTISNAGSEVAHAAVATWIK